jgi:hypothetical protein
METSYRGRRAVTIENSRLRVTVTREGGHIAEILHKETSINPLWSPPWTSVDPSTVPAGGSPEYGADAEARLLAGILGHNACIDLFGGPSPEEAAAGMTVHGEASILPYEIAVSNGELRASVSLPMAQLLFERRIELHDDAVRIRESVRNLSSCDRPIAWTQHVTLGPPFLENGVTQFRASATRSKVFEEAFGAGDYLKTGAEFDWPMAPLAGEGVADLRVMNGAPVSGAFTTHLMDPRREHAFFVAYDPATKLAFGYVWRQADFPWLGIWEENHSRTHAPWNGSTLARGMEFGVSPMPEPRRCMIARGSLFGVPAYRWLPAQSQLEAEYWAVARRADSIPETLAWPT